MMASHQDSLGTSEIATKSDDNIRAEEVVNPAIRITDLVKTYPKRSSLTSSIDVRRYLAAIRGKVDGRVQALNGVNLNVSQGEVFGLLGPNGAGKTTIIKILSTLVLPNSGFAYVQGVDVVRHPRKAVRMLQTVLAEGIGFERRLSGRQNLEFYATLYGIPRGEARARIDELLAFCGLTQTSDEMFQKYSTGMARRLLVCRALLTDASVLMFDEPTAGLDPISGAEFRKLMKDVLAKKKGKTVFLSTHNLWEAQNICDRIAVLRSGKIIATGTPSEIRKIVADKVSLTVMISGSTNGSVSELLKTLPNLGGFVNTEIVKSGENGNLTLRVKGTRELDYDGFFALIASLRLRIVNLEASQPSLEEAFLRLTDESQN